MARSGMRVRHLNLSHPEHSAALQAPLAEHAGGWGLCLEDDGTPVFDSTNDPDYWRIRAALSRVECRNEPGVKELIERSRRESPPIPTTAMRAPR